MINGDFALQNQPNSERKDAFAHAKAIIKKMKDCRLQKYVSDCGLMSRRAAESEILAGHFTVNGKVAALGDKIDREADYVEYKGKEVKCGHVSGYTYIMLNKPRGYVTTMSDDKGRQCVADLVKGVGIRVYPVGRLDVNTEGLLLMTNDGAFTEHLTHPRHEIPKIYRMRVRGDLSENDLERLSYPMMIDGYRIQPVKCVVTERTGQSTVLELTLYEGRNRQIRKMCEKVGLTIRSLKRIAIGELTLGNLPVGKWEYLTPSQVKYLMGDRK